MSIKVGEVIEILDECGNWTTETITHLGKHTFWVSGAADDVPYLYREHKTEWRKRAQTEQK